MSIYRASVLSICSLEIYLSYDSFVSKVEVPLVWEINKSSEKVGFSILTESTKLLCYTRKELECNRSPTGSSISLAPPPLLQRCPLSCFTPGLLFQCFVFFVFVFFHFFGTACRILVLWSGIRPMPLALEAWILHHWTPREVPALSVYMKNHLFRASGNFVPPDNGILLQAGQLNISIQPS